MKKEEREIRDFIDSNIAILALFDYKTVKQEESIPAGEIIRIVFNEGRDILREINVYFYDRDDYLALIKVRKNAVGQDIRKALIKNGIREYTRDVGTLSDEYRIWFYSIEYFINIFNSFKQHLPK